MDRKRTFPPIVGISSLLVIFSALCLTVFTLLTISTARAERRLSDVSAEAVSAYYNADTEAELIFAQIRDGKVPEGVTVDGQTYTYTCQITPTLFLHVQLMMRDGTWTVLSWQPVSSNK
jgi:hypothetical protein